MCTRGQACTVSSSHHLCSEFLGVFIQIFLKIMSHMCRQRGFSAHPEPMWGEYSLLTLLGYMGENHPNKCNPDLSIGTSFLEWGLKAVQLQQQEGSGMMDDRGVLPVNMHLGFSLPLVWKAWSRDRISVFITVMLQFQENPPWDFYTCCLLLFLLCCIPHQSWL